MGKRPNKSSRDRPPRSRAKPIDRWLWLAGAAVAILLFLFAKTPLVVLICVVVLFGLLVHPVWNFWWIEKDVRRRLLALVGLALVCSFIAYAAWPAEILLRGVLVADSKISPPNDCDIPANDVAIYVGNSIAHTSAQSFTLIEVGDEKLIYVERTSVGLVITATIRDQSGAVVAKITRNVFKSESNAKYEPKSPDAHTFYVLDDKDQVILFVDYLNPNALKVLGRFYYPGYPAIIIEEEKQIIGGTIHVRSCFGSFKQSALKLG